MTMGYLDSHPDPDAKVAEAINLISGLVAGGCSSSSPRTWR
jgi:hypothetical protein